MYKVNNNWGPSRKFLSEAERFHYYFNVIPAHKLEPVTIQQNIPSKSKSSTARIPEDPIQSSSSMSSDADKELMEAALRQLDGKINYQQLAADLGMNSANSASKRWCRFKAKLVSGETRLPAAQRSDEASRSAITTNTEVTGNSKQKGREKRKRAQPKEDDKESEQDEVKGAKEDMAEQNGSDGTPFQKHPARKAHTLSFKKESSKLENTGVGAEGADSGPESGHCIMKETEGVVDDEDEI